MSWVGVRYCGFFSFVFFFFSSRRRHTRCSRDWSSDVCSSDLLRELDRMEFYVYETRELVKAKHRPIVFITSNNEKELPDAFLRRCFFHYIRFPDRETMERIVAVHFPALKRSLLRAAMEVFFAVR